MLKVLRKYNKWFLAVGGTLLLVTFLVSNVADLFRPDPAKFVVAKIGTEKVLRAEHDRAQREYEALKQLAFATVMIELQIENSTHWMLLAREAEEAGLIGDAGDGESWMPELAENEARTMAYFRARQGDYQMLFQLDTFVQQFRETLPGLRDNVAQQARLTHEGEFDQIIAKLRGVRRLMSLYMAAPRFSDRRGLIGAREARDAVLADVLLVQSDRLISQAPEPTPEQIQVQYEAFKAVNPGEGENGFGYSQPARIKLEWLQLSAAAVREAITLDGLAVYKHYTQNRTQYPGEFPAEKAKIEAAMKEERVREILNQFDAIYKARLKAVSRRLASDGSVRKLPDDWATQRPTMESLAADVTQALRDETGLLLPLPSVSVRAATWTRVDQLVSVPGIGAATAEIGQRRARLVDVISNLYELNPDGGLGIQARFPWDHFLSDGSGNRYYFCVLGVLKAGEPESLDEVRDQVVTDLKRKWGFEKLDSELPVVQASAASSGLAEAAKLFEIKSAEGTLVQPAPQVNKDLRVTRTGVSIPALNVPEFRDRVLDASAKLGRLETPTPENAGARTIAVALPKTLSVAIAQITYPQPMTVEAARLLGRQDLMGLLTDEVEDAAKDRKNPFSFTELKQRIGYVETEKSGKS